MEAKHRTGRPSKGYGPRHTVAVKLTPSQMEKLRQIAETEGKQPGPYLTEFAQDHIGSIDLDRHRAQEALPIDKAG